MPLIRAESRNVGGFFRTGAQRRSTSFRRLNRKGKSGGTMHLTHTRTNSSALKSLLCRLFFLSIALCFAQLNADNLWAAASTQVESTGPMQLSRQGHTATLLPDGRVLMVGGRGAGGVLDSIELYDPAAKQFSPAGDPAAPTRLTQARSAHTATLVKVADGSWRVVIAGGIDAGSLALSSIEIFDPATGTILATDHLATARSSHTATLMADGRVFFAGGDADGTAELYDPDNLLGPVTYQLNGARSAHTATLFSDGSVFLAGGSTAEFVNPADPALSSGIIQLLAVRSGHTALVGPDQNVYLIGGDPANSVEKFDPFSQSVSPVLSLPAPHSTAIGLANSQALVIGASGASVLNLLSNSFQVLTNTELARAGATATDLPGDHKILVAGGVDNNNALLDLGALFNPARVTTDYDDYPPGTPVGITGSGFKPNETVQLQVLHIGDTPPVDDNETSPPHEPWTAPADANGNLDTTWNIPAEEDELGATLEVTAKGLMSGLIAKATFTDAANISVSISTQSPNLVCPGSIATYTVAVQEGGNPSANTVTLSITTTLPSGVIASFSPASLSFSENSTKTSTLTLTTASGTPSSTTSFTVQASSSSSPPGNTTTSGNLAVGVPDPAGSISGSATVCQGQSGVAYSIAAVARATSYAWSYSGSGATISGTGNSVTIAFSTTATSGSLTVQPQNSCGNGTVSPAFAITVNPLPAAAGSISGSATVCKGQSGVSYSVAAIANAASYTWSYSGIGATISGTGNSVTISFSGSATSGILTVKGHNACGDGTVSPNFAITVNDCAGPITSSVGVSPSPANGTTLPTVTASVTDFSTGNSTIAGAEFFIDAVGADGTGTAMNAQDGAFNEVSDPVSKQLTSSQFAALSEGSHTVYVHARDAVGNWGATASAIFTKDTTPPLAPSTPDLTTDDGCSSTDNITTDTTPTFTGTAEAGASVKIFVDGVQNGSAVTATGGSYTKTTTTLTAGVHDITATATDAVGNVSPASAPLSITILVPVSDAPASLGTAATETAGATTAISGVTAAAGNTILVVFAMDDPSGAANSWGAVSATDTGSGGSNAYTVDADVRNNGSSDSAANGVRVVVLRAPVTHALSSGSITMSHPSVAARAARVMVVSGLASSPIDQTATSTGPSGTPSVGPTPATTQADELILAVFGYEEAAGFTPAGGYTEVGGDRVRSGNNSSASVSIAAEYKILSATGTQSASGMLGSGASADYAAALLTYKVQVPGVVSVLRANSSPTCASSVDFTVTFSETVFGVDAADFALATSGVSGASITGISGSGSTYTVTVSTGSGSGTLGLNVVANACIVDSDANRLGGTGGNSLFTGESYIIGSAPE